MDKKPLYRKINKKTHNGWASYTFRKERYRFERGKKQNYLPEHSPIKRSSSFTTGYDYSPLYHFLLTHVGQVWGPVFQECQYRLDKLSPMTYMVVNVNEHGIVVDNHPDGVLPDFFRCEDSYWSTLWVDEKGILQFVNKDFNLEDIVDTLKYPTKEFTITWNGRPIWPEQAITNEEK